MKQTPKSLLRTTTTNSFSSIECDGLRQSTMRYAQLGGIAFGLSVLTLSLRFENTERYVWRRSRCVSARCNRPTARVATAYCRHDRGRVSVTVPDVTS